jgi:hypothetical protein
MGVSVAKPKNSDETSKKELPDTQADDKNEVVGASEDTDKSTQAPDTDSAKHDVVDAESVDGTPPQDDGAAAEATDVPKTDEISGSDEGVASSEPVSEAPQSESRRSPVPLILGGIVAAALGFGASYLGFANQPASEEEALRGVVEAQQSEIDLLRSTVADLTTQVNEVASAESAPDIEALRSDIISAFPEVPDVRPELDDLRTDIDAIRTRIDNLASTATGGASDLTSEELSAFQAELDQALQGAQSKMADAVAAAQADLESVRETAANVEAQAEKAAEKAAVEAALARVAAALDAGTSFAGPLADIESAGGNIPDALASAASDGVASLPALTDAYPASARAALEGSISVEDAGSATDRVMAFLRVQTGARSLTPREGDDPDAILSRSEAALRAGDLSSALAELDALPDAGKAAMADWVSAARTRQAAVAALAALRSEIETN